MAGYLYVHSKLQCLGQLTITWNTNPTPTVISIDDEYNIADLKALFQTYNVAMENNIANTLANSEKIEDYTNYIVFYCYDLTDDINGMEFSPKTGDTSFIAYNNILNILGMVTSFTVTNVIVQGFGLFSNWFRSRTFGARIPMRLYFNDTRARGGFSKKLPITKKIGGEDKVTLNDVFSHNRVVRRGYTITLTLSTNQLELLDIFMQTFKAPCKLRFTGTSVFSNTKNYTMLIHEGADVSEVYDTADVNNTELVILGDSNV